MRSAEIRFGDGAGRRRRKAARGSCRNIIRSTNASVLTAAVPVPRQNSLRLSRRRGPDVESVRAANMSPLPFPCDSMTSRTLRSGLSRDRPPKRPTTVSFGAARKGQQEKKAKATGCLKLCPVIFMIPRGGWNQKEGKRPPYGKRLRKAGKKVR
jgi:hypothetical protein